MSIEATPRRLARGLLALTLLAGALAACSSGGSSKTVTTGSTAPPTVPGPAQKAAYAGTGPFQSGTETLLLGDGRRVVVWYPAAASAASQPTETYDLASLLSPQLQSKIPADLRPQYEIDTHPGAPAAKAGPFPIVLFSHGYAGFPEQSADLVTHLSRWGFIVVAPDHEERSLDGLLGTGALHIKPSTDLQVLSRSLDLIIADGQRPASPVYGKVDARHVAVIGHSTGARAAYDMAGTDARVTAFISYAVSLTDQDPGATTVPRAPTPPAVAGMVMTGSRDGVIPPAQSIATYNGMQAPKYLVEIADSGHLVFSDLCLIGADKGGLAALATRIGLAIPADLIKLAKDGCGPGYADTRLAFPAIDHFSVAFLRAIFGIDPHPVGLNPAVVSAFRGPKVRLTTSQR